MRNESSQFMWWGPLDIYCKTQIIKTRSPIFTKGPKITWARFIKNTAVLSPQFKGKKIREQMINCTQCDNKTSRSSSSHLKPLDMLDLLSRVQTLWAGTSTVQYGVTAVELEFIINGLQSLLGVLITAVAYPPANIIADNISGLNNKQRKHQ